MSDTEAFWAGTFGNDYTARNRVDWHARIPFWESALEFTAANAILEVGCNAGWNLRAIQQIAPDADLLGVDLNDIALEEARQAGFEVRRARADAVAGLFGAASMDLVFTSGVLIHIGPDDLEAAMRAIIDTSAKYVLAIEYEAAETEALEYRGHKGKLWKRPYGQLYQALGLKLLSEGVAGGFDQCTYWLLQKGAVE